MAKSALSDPAFHDEAAAFAMLESIVWPNGPTCPKCGAVDRKLKVIARQKPKDEAEKPRTKKADPKAG